MKISKLIATVATATILGAGAASAATFGDIPGGTATNEALAPLGFNNPLSGWYGANLFLAGPATVTATLLGAEAGYENSFTMGSNTMTDPAGGNAFSLAGFDSFTTTVTAGLLDFSFHTSGGNLSVANGANPDNTVPAPNPGINFFVSYGNGTTDQTTSGDVVWLFFDDDGASNDDNHDDLVIKLTIDSGPGGGINIVPVPAAGFLLVGALGGLAGLRRRKKKAA